MLDQLGKSVRLSRKRLRLTQHELAREVGISRKTLVRIENGSSDVGQDMVDKVLDYIAESERHEPLECIFDYVRVTFPMHNQERLFNKVLRIRQEFFAEIDSHQFGYMGVFQLDYIKVAYSAKNDDRGLMIELSGQGCRQFEAFLQAQNRTWFDFFYDCLDFNCRFTRIDIAVNDYKEYLSIPTLLNKVLRQELISKFDLFRFNGSGRISKRQQEGTTIYFGSSKSEFYIAFYQKNYEHAKKLGLRVEDIPIKNRYELRFKNDRAMNAILEYLRLGSLTDIILGVLNDYLLFVDGKRGVKRKYWKPNKKWQFFIGDVGAVKLVTEPNEKLYERTRNWFQRSVAANVKMLEDIDDMMGENTVREMIDEAELSDKHLHIIEVKAMEIADFIV
ncbi:replication initiation factor domain-containing protein [Enterococcus sp. HY326]|uniref:replication initiation factor domain-containing protein n=1 Tax=Enterococcus sp. HY326 TaxID=2971265 RepID=UPI0022400A06|nr:replication initiation factor domain-containing protein [Enterococcus sp. HY326]